LNLGSADTAWWVGRRIAPRVTVTLAPAAGYGVERVPRKGGGVVAANHFSAIDHPLIGSFSPRPLYFLAKAELFEIPVLGPLLSWLGVFAVRRGEGDREAVRRARELVREGHLVCVHVEGTRQRFGHPGPLHPGGLMIAMQEGVPVIPCGLDTFGWSPANRRLCAVVWGDPMRLDDLPRNRRGYSQATEIVGAAIVRLWRQAAYAAAEGLPPELPDGAKRSGINPKVTADGAGPPQADRRRPAENEPPRLAD
jgi:1-acyl-sn-glycerol-3-phosphate acyltransferase